MDADPRRVFLAPTGDLRRHEVEDAMTEKFNDRFLVDFTGKNFMKGNFTSGSVRDEAAAARKIRIKDELVTIERCDPAKRSYSDHDGDKDRSKKAGRSRSPARDVLMGMDREDEDLVQSRMKLDRKSECKLFFGPITNVPVANLIRKVEEVVGRENDSKLYLSKSINPKFAFGALYPHSEDLTDKLIKASPLYVAGRNSRLQPLPVHVEAAGEPTPFEKINEQRREEDMRRIERRDGGGGGGGFGDGRYFERNENRYRKERRRSSSYDDRQRDRRDRDRGRYRSRDRRSQDRDRSRDRGRDRSRDYGRSKRGRSYSDDKSSRASMKKENNKVEEEVAPAPMAVAPAAGYDVNLLAALLQQQQQQQQQMAQIMAAAGLALPPGLGAPMAGVGGLPPADLMMAGGLGAATGGNLGGLPPPASMDPLQQQQQQQALMMQQQQAMLQSMMMMQQQPPLQQQQQQVPLEAPQPQFQAPPPPPPAAPATGAAAAPGDGGEAPSPLAPQRPQQQLDANALLQLQLQQQQQFQQPPQ